MDNFVEGNVKSSLAIMLALGDINTLLSLLGGLFILLSSIKVLLDIWNHRAFTKKTSVSDETDDSTAEPGSIKIP